MPLKYGLWSNVEVCVALQLILIYKIWCENYPIKPQVQSPHNPIG
jgi:hypothetical protein